MSKGQNALSTWDFHSTGEDRQNISFRGSTVTDSGRGVGGRESGRPREPVGVSEGRASGECEAHAAVRRAREQARQGPWT